MELRLYSFNVNGLRAVINKGFYDFLDKEKPDIIGLQETKMQEGQAEIDTKGYYTYMNSAEKKGYSGTMVFSKIKPLSVHYGLKDGTHNDEGRVITCEYDKFYFITIYSPNSKEGLIRIPYRCEFEDALREYLSELKSKKIVYVCGDLNVAHNEIDLKNPDSNHFNPGFSDEERGKFSELLNSGFIDSFRYLYKDTVKYSWWSYRMQARIKNVGWRIDYFLVSENGRNTIVDSEILNDVEGSDHCPVKLTINI